MYTSLFVIFSRLNNGTDLEMQQKETCKHSEYGAYKLYEGKIADNCYVVNLLQQHKTRDQTSKQFTPAFVQKLNLICNVILGTYYRLLEVKFIYKRFMNSYKVSVNLPRGSDLEWTTPNLLVNSRGSINILPFRDVFGASQFELHVNIHIGPYSDLAHAQSRF